MPLVVSGPGVKSGATAKGFSVITDIAPTLLDLAGVDPAPAPAAPMDGRSLRAVLSGAADSPYGPADPVVMEAAGDAALWKGNLKLVRAAGPLGDPTWRLYDMAVDPGETLDLSAARPAEAAALLADYRAYATRVGVAEIPAGYTPDKQVSRKILNSLLTLYRLPLLIGLAVVLAALAFTAWRLHRSGDRPLQIAARMLLGIVGVLALLIASRFWLAPQTAGAAFAL